MRGLIVMMLAFLVGALSVSELAAGPEWGRSDGEVKVFGAGLTGEETMLVSTLLADPDAYVGKTVRVSGIAVGVCAHRGCWVNIASDVEGDVVRVKVTDGEIVFPPEIMGDVITAEGVWTANKLDLETTKQVCSHKASEEGKPFDPDSVTECMTLYQITGTGAVVQPAPPAKENSD